MVDGVVGLAGVRRDERDAHGVRELLHIVHIRAGQALELRIEVAQVLLELGRGVAVGVDADQDHLQLIHSLFGQLALDLAQLGEGGGADVRAEGVAEEQQAPLAFQLIDQHRLAVLVGHAHRRQLATLRQQDDASIDERGGVALAFARKHFVDGQAHDQRDDGDQDKDGFLSSSHRFNSR